MHDSTVPLIFAEEDIRHIVSSSRLLPGPSEVQIFSSIKYSEAPSAYDPPSV